MPRSWEPDFDFYEADFDEAHVAIFVDLAALSRAPVSTHPLRLQMRVKMRAPRADGLRSPDEEVDLFALEDAIVAKTEAAIDGVYVGRIVAQGYTTFAFYVPLSAAPRAENANVIVGSVAPYALEWNVADDIEWAYYKELLYPDPESYARMLSRRAADRITGGGRAGRVDQTS